MFFGGLTAHRTYSHGRNHDGQPPGLMAIFSFSLMVTSFVLCLTKLMPTNQRLSDVSKDIGLLVIDWWLFLPLVQLLRMVPRRTSVRLAALSTVPPGRKHNEIHSGLWSTLLSTPTSHLFLFFLWSDFVFRRPRLFCLGRQGGFCFFAHTKLVLPKCEICIF